MSKKSRGWGVRKKKAEKPVTPADLVVMPVSFVTKIPEEPVVSNVEPAGTVLASPPIRIMTVPSLDTSVIGPFCYYNVGQTIDLGSVLPAFYSYTLHDDYVDGTVRVWDSTNTGASSPVNRDSYLDVKARVRADGWVLTWLERTQDRGRFLWWGYANTQPTSESPDYGAPDSGTFNYKADGTSISPTMNTTILGRACQLLMSAGSLPGFDWAKLKYYDYEYTSAKRLFIFGYSNYRVWSSATVIDDKYFYVTVPSGKTVSHARLAVGLFWRQTGVSPNYNLQFKTEVDGNTQSNISGTGNVPMLSSSPSIQIYSIGSLLSPGSQHSIRVYSKAERVSGGGEANYFWHKAGIVVWLAG